MHFSNKHEFRFFLTSFHLPKEVKTTYDEMIADGKNSCPGEHVKKGKRADQFEVKTKIKTLFYTIKHENKLIFHRSLIENGHLSYCLPLIYTPSSSLHHLLHHQPPSFSPLTSANLLTFDPKEIYSVNLDHFLFFPPSLGLADHHLSL